MTAVGRYLLDTSVLIDLSHGVGLVRDWFDARIASGDELGICGVIVGEVFAGALPADRARWRRFVSGLEYWDISPGAAIQAGIYRYDFARQGRVVHLPDALIAATAIEVGAVLVTNNVKDFPMPDLRLLRLGA